MKKASIGIFANKERVDFVSSTFFQMNVSFYQIVYGQIEKDFAFDIYVGAFCYAAPS